jgi:two-component system, OmpR family, sensor kinase
MSLRRRLLLTLAPLFVVGLVIANVATYIGVRSFLYSRVDDQLFSTHISVENALRGNGSPGRPDEGPGGGGPGAGAALPQFTYGCIVSPSGSLEAHHTFVFGNSTDETDHPVLTSAVLSPTGSVPQYFTLAGVGAVSQYRAYLDTTHDGSGNLVLAAIPIDDLNSTLSHLLLLELGVSGGVTLAIVAATWLLVRRGMRPLVRMGDTARIAATDLSRRVSPSTEKTEVGRLGLALNTMLSQLEAAFAERARNEERLRHFVSDASHELRTPLTSMQGYAELIRRRPDMERDDVVLALRRMEEESRRMGVLVDDLLLLARLDQGRPLERGSVDLEALVSDAVADARAVDPKRAITASVAAPLVVTGDEMRLRQVLGNVVRNALVHTPAGTPVELRLHPQDSAAVVDVVDHGPGIPKGHAERIFERFHRAEPDRSRDQGGSGLGLSIASAVLAAHGGRISVLDTPGGGATFRIVLPLANGTAPPAAPELPGDSEQTHGAG